MKSHIGPIHACPLLRKGGRSQHSCTPCGGGMPGKVYAFRDNHEVNTINSSVPAKPVASTSSPLFQPHMPSAA